MQETISRLLSQKRNAIHQQHRRMTIHQAFAKFRPTFYTVNLKPQQLDDQSFVLLTGPILVQECLKVIFLNSQGKSVGSHEDLAFQLTKEQVVRQIQFQKEEFVPKLQVQFSNSLSMLVQYNQLRDQAIRLGLFQLIQFWLNSLKKASQRDEQREALVWLLLRTVRNEVSDQHKQKVLNCLSIIHDSELNKQTLSHFLYILSYLTSDKSMLPALASFHRFLIDKSGSPQKMIFHPAARSLFNLASGCEERVCKEMIDLGLLQIIQKFLLSENMIYRREAAWALGLLSTRPSLIPRLIRFVGTLNSMVMLERVTVKKEMLITLGIMAANADSTCRDQLIDLQTFDTLVTGLDLQCAQVLSRLILGLRQLMGHNRQLIKLGEERGLLKRIEQLQAHPCQLVYQLISLLIHQFFSDRFYTAQ